MPDKRGRAGGTYVDPDNPGGMPPRLFRNRTAAKNALAWWAEGRAVISRDYEYGTTEIIGMTPVESRNAADWEIVPVQLTRTAANG